MAAKLDTTRQDKNITFGICHCVKFSFDSVHCICDFYSIRDAFCLSLRAFQTYNLFIASTSECDLHVVYKRGGGTDFDLFDTRWRVRAAALQVAKGKDLSSNGWSIHIFQIC